MAMLDTFLLTTINHHSPWLTIMNIMINHHSTWLTIIHHDKTNYNPKSLTTIITINHY